MRSLCDICAAIRSKTLLNGFNLFVFLFSLLSLYILLLLYLSSCVCYCFYCDCYFCFSLYVPVHLLVTIKFHSPNVWTISFFPNTLLPSIVSHLLTIRDKSYISSNSLLLHYPVKIA